MKVRPIQIETLWNKFKGKFGWTILQPEEIMLIPSVQPVTQIDDMLDNLEEVAEETSTATTGVHVFTVPISKKWSLVAVSVVRAETGAFKVEIDDPGSTSVLLASDSTATSHIYTFNPPITLDESWALKVTNLTGVSGLITTNLMYQSRDAM